MALRINLKISRFSESCSFSRQSASVLDTRGQDSPGRQMSASPRIRAPFRGRRRLLTSTRQSLESISTSERRQPLTTASLPAPPPVRHVGHVSPLKAQRDGPLIGALRLLGAVRCLQPALFVCSGLNCSDAYCNEIKAGQVNGRILRGCLGVQAICC